MSEVRYGRVHLRVDDPVMLLENIDDPRVVSEFTKLGASSKQVSITLDPGYDKNRTQSNVSRLVKPLRKWFDSIYVEGKLQTEK